MKRTLVAVAAAAVAALVVTACGSLGGTAQSPSSSSSSQSSSSSESSLAGQAANTESSSPQASTEPTAGGSSSTVTISGDLDAQSAAWFGAVCTGLSPVVEQAFGLMSSAMSSLGGSGDPAKIQQQLVAAISTMASSMDSAAKTIGAVPPPTLANGKQMAQDIVAALGKSAPQLKQVADQLQAEKVTTMEQLQQAMSSLNSSLTSGMDGLSFDKYDLDPKIQDAMKKLPACAPLYSFAQSASPTS